jgi:type VI protein secretion system component VasF
MIARLTMEVQGPILEVLLWFVAVGFCMTFALVWLLYLLKLVENEDEAEEKVRRYQRIAEEILRGK